MVGSGEGEDVLVRDAHVGEDVLARLQVPPDIVRLDVYNECGEKDDDSHGDAEHRRDVPDTRTGRGIYLSHPWPYTLITSILPDVPQSAPDVTGKKAYS
jgi:hypothetical protein